MRWSATKLAWAPALCGVGAFSGPGTAAADSLAERLAIQAPAKRAEAPAFTLPDLKGKLVSIESFRGRVVFLNFWATWCGPCRVEMPSMERLYRRYKDQGLVVPLPTTFFVGCDGLLLGRAIGARDWDRPEGLAYVAELLGLSKPAAAKEGACRRER